MNPNDIFEELFVRPEPFIERQGADGQTKVYIAGNVAHLWRNGAKVGVTNYEDIWQRLTELEQDGALNDEHILYADKLLSVLKPQAQGRYGRKENVSHIGRSLRRRVIALYDGTRTQRAVAKETGLKKTQVTYVLQQAGVYKPKLPKKPLKVTLARMGNVFDWSIYRVHQLAFGSTLLPVDVVERGMRAVGWTGDNLRERIQARLPYVAKYIKAP